jgi:hypothetical protein
MSNLKSPTMWHVASHLMTMLDPFDWEVDVMEENRHLRVAITSAEDERIHSNMVLKPRAAEAALDELAIYINGYWTPRQIRLFLQSQDAVVEADHSDSEEV